MKPNVQENIVNPILLKSFSKKFPCITICYFQMTNVNHKYIEADKNGRYLQYNCTEIDS